MNQIKSINHLGLIIFFLLLMWSSVPALDYYVSAFWGSDATGDGSTTAPWATIQYAINRAVVNPPNPTNIKVDLGTYTENIVLKNNIHLYGGYNSQLGWQRDVNRFTSRIKAASAAPGTRTVYLKPDTRLDGFTISDGFFGVYCDVNAPMTIFNNVIEKHLHYGIVSLNGARPLIEKNTIRNNKGGVLCVTNAAPILIENTISYNNEHGVYCNLAAPIIFQNLILNNFGSGVELADFASAIIVANFVYYNWGNGILCANSQPLIAQNFIANNSQGIYCKNQSQVFVENNTLVSNLGSGILLKESGGELRNNIFSNNLSYGIEEADEFSDPAVIYNCFYNNLLADYLDEGTSPSIGALAINTRVINTPQPVANNISGDPLFADPYLDNFHLTSGSLCIDAGTTTTYSFDIDLESRPFDVSDIDNNGILPEVDIGADEFVNYWSYDFEPDPQGWMYGNAAPVYSAALPLQGAGYIGLRATDHNCFGFWTSLPEVKVLPGFIYRLQFTLRSEETNPALSPGVRLRVNRKSYKTAADTIVLSTGGGENSPTTTPALYQLFVEPIQGPIAQNPAGSDRMLISFDILNFDPGDNPAGAIYLDSVTVDSYPAGALEDKWVTEAIYSFDNGAQGWQPGGAPGVFDLPEFSARNGALYLKAGNNTNTFGYWYSPPLPAVADKLYRAQLFISTDQSSRVLTPTFRLRLNDVNGQLAGTYCVYSLDDADASPNRNESLEYHLYLAMRDHIPAQVASVDIINLDPDDAVTGEIIVYHFSLESCSLSVFP